MSVAVICCRMLEKELKKAYESFTISAPVYWLDAGLHNYPEKLRDSLQVTLDSLPSDVTRVVMLYSLCGQAVLGLKTRNFELVMPRTDDCIALLLDGNDIKIENTGTYFLTDAWLDDENSLMNEYKYALNKYGQQRCDRIFKRQFAHYNVLGILDTGCYDVNALIEKTEPITDVLELTPKVIPTKCDMLNTLISCAADDKSQLPDTLGDNFIYVNKNSEITQNMFFRM